MVREADLRRGEGIGGVPVGRNEVNGKGVALSSDEEHEGHYHSHGGTMGVGGHAR